VAVAACAGPPVGEPAPAAVGDTSTESPVEWSGNTRHVPADYPTIQAAVDASDPGDLVLIEPGVYRESVDVRVPGVTLRGVDRNEVVIDGEFERANGIQVIFTDGVVVENLTTINNTLNGVFWSGVRGYRASYVTAVNNGDYGIYAFDSGDGLFEHSYASGSPDASYYIGQCNPCDAVITDSIGEFSGLGYSGSNASGDLYLVNNVFRYNGTGAAPNSLDGELLPPAERVVVAGNLIHDNGYGEFPHKTAQWATQGMGIALAGTVDSLVTRNRIVNHPLNGVQVFPMIDANVWMPSGNQVSGNIVAGSGLADLTLTGPSQSGNCFSGNEHGSTMPAALEAKQSCDGLRFPALWEFGRPVGPVRQGDRTWSGARTPTSSTADCPTHRTSRRCPVAPMPRGPGRDVFAQARPDLDSITVPPLPEGLQVTQQKGPNIMGVPFATTYGAFIGLYAYVLPLVLFAVWVAIAVWEIVTRRDDLGRGAGIGWILAILIVPFLGVIAYYVFGKSRIPVAYRWVLLAGGMGAYLLFLVLGLVVGGVV
jgi:hypothetical protein